ncbi:amino acid ABC transporter permease [Sediminivirga luteola]|uniref:amino acid ABC transporter permease n=1 Tax=Sediminivirga luteola TaxID=1774748 RepID=UPI001F5796E6|nr:amino acid ABC transporter permease [Sediminivirga luteola]MCI2265236.1 amino acid ABC transporter permease [Sediminivirga luteola]
MQKLADHLERDADEFVIRPRRHYGRTLAAIVVGVLAVSLAGAIVTNPNFDWPTVGSYLFAQVTINGLLVTLYLTVASMVLGIVGGVLMALMSMSKNPVLRIVAWGYITVFRGIPTLVQILFWGFLGAFFPRIAVGIPFTDITFVDVPTSSLISATGAAILALGLNEVAYMAEIIRGGIRSVDQGQREAAAAMGMSPGLIMRKIILPQAMRVVIPPTGNETITVLKTSSLVSVIAGNDLMTNIQQIYSQNYKVIPLLIVASLWYLTVTVILSFFQSRIERRFGQSDAVQNTARKG